jgi:MFS family permease
MIGGKMYDFFQVRSMRATHVFLSVAVFILSGCLVAFPLVTSLPLLLVVFVVFGISVGLVNQGTNILCMWTWKEKVTPIILALSCTAGVGSFLGPFMISLNIPFEYVYWITAAMAAGSGAILYFGQTCYTILAVTEEESNSKVAAETDNEATDVGDQEFETSRFSILMNNTKNLRVSLVIGLALFGAVGLESCVGGLAFTYIENQHLAKTESQNALMSSALWISFTAGRLVASFLSGFISPALILVTNVVCCFLSIIIFLLIANVAMPTIGLLWLAIILMGLGVSSQFPTAMSFPTTSMNNIRVSGVMSSIMIVMASSAEMTVPLMITKWFGVANLFWILLFVASTSAIAYTILFIWALRIKWNNDDAVPIKFEKL